MSGPPVAAPRHSRRAARRWPPCGGAVPGPRASRHVHHDGLLVRDTPTQTLPLPAHGPGEIRGQCAARTRTECNAKRRRGWHEHDLGGRPVQGSGSRFRIEASADWHQHQHHQGDRRAPGGGHVPPRHISRRGAMPGAGVGRRSGQRSLRRWSSTTGVVPCSRACPPHRLCRDGATAEGAPRYRGAPSVTAAALSPRPGAREPYVSPWRRCCSIPRRLREASQGRG